MRFFPENLTFLGVPGGSVLMTGIPVIKEEQALHCAQVILFSLVVYNAQCNGNRFLHAISRNLGVKTGQIPVRGPPRTGLYMLIYVD